MNITLKNAISKIKSIPTGQFFKVVFIKRTDGSRREMLCRTGVQKYLRGGTKAYEPDEKNLMFVWDADRFNKLCTPDMFEQERQSVGESCFRSINLETLISLTYAGITYNITHDEIPAGRWRISWRDKGTEMARMVDACDSDQAKLIFKRETNLRAMPRGATVVRL